MNNNRSLVLLALMTCSVIALSIISEGESLSPIKISLTDDSPGQEPPPRQSMSLREELGSSAQSQDPRTEDDQESPTDPVQYGQLLGSVYNYDGTPATGMIGFFRGGYERGAKIHTFPVSADGRYMSGGISVQAPDMSALDFDQATLTAGDYTAVFKTGEQDVWECLDNMYGNQPVQVAGGVRTHDFILRSGYVVTGTIETDFGFDADENSTAFISIWAGTTRDSLVAIGVARTFGTDNRQRRNREARFTGDLPGTVESGEFHFSNLPPGLYTLRYSAGERGSQTLFVARCFEVIDDNVHLAPEVIGPKDFDTKDPNPIPFSILAP